MYCSFCGKNACDVELLIKGRPNVAICNECVELCNIVIAEYREHTQYRAIRAILFDELWGTDI